MKNITVKDAKILEAIKLDVKTASIEELASAFLTLNDLSIRVQKQYNAVNTAMMKLKEEERQTSMFEDETFSNSYGEVSLVEDKTPVHSLNRKGLLEHVGCPTQSVKYGNYVYAAPTVKEKAIFKDYEAGTLDSDIAGYVSSVNVCQTKMTWKNDKEEK